MIYRQRPAHAPRAPNAPNATLHAPLYALYAHARPPLCSAVWLPSLFWWLCSAERLFGASVGPVCICIWCTIHYLEMQYLVQRDKGCELRHKGSVSPMAAAVRRWANIRASPPCCYVRPCINFVSRTGLAIFIYGIRFNPCIIYCSG